MVERQQLRPKNWCLNCGHAWYPRGTNLSRCCPCCKSLSLLVETELWFCSSAISWFMLVIICVFCLAGIILTSKLVSMMIFVFFFSIVIIVTVVIYGKYIIPQARLDALEFARNLFNEIIHRNPEFITQTTLYLPDKLSFEISEEIINLFRNYEGDEEKHTELKTKPSHLSTSRMNVRKTVPKAMRKLIWERMYNDKNRGLCNVCNNTTISAFDFHCGHIIAVAKGGTNHIDNLIPICALCNTSMQTENVHDFKLRFYSD